MKSEPLFYWFLPPPWPHIDAFLSESRASGEAIIAEHTGYQSMRSLKFYFSIDIIRQIVYNCYTFLERGYVSLTRSVQRSERHRLSPPPLLAQPPQSVKVLSHPLTWATEGGKGNSLWNLYLYIHIHKTWIPLCLPIYTPTLPCTHTHLGYFLHNPTSIASKRHLPSIAIPLNPYKVRRFYPASDHSTFRPRRTKRCTSSRSTTSNDPPAPVQIPTPTASTLSPSGLKRATKCKRAGLGLPWTTNPCSATGQTS